MAIQQRTRLESRFDTEITGFREVTSDDYIDDKTNLDFNFELETVTIDLKMNKMIITGWINYYDLQGNIFKQEKYSYQDVDTPAQYEIVETYDTETGEVIEVISETKLQDEYLPITNWDSQLGAMISTAIINQFQVRNGLD